MLSLLFVFVGIGILWLLQGRRSGISRDGRRLPYDLHSLQRYGSVFLSLTCPFEQKTTKHPPFARQRSALLASPAQAIPVVHRLRTSLRFGDL